MIMVIILLCEINIINDINDDNDIIISEVMTDNIINIEMTNDSND